MKEYGIWYIVKGCQVSVYLSKRIFEEAQRLFEHNMEDLEMEVTDFYKDKYALWIDLRTTSSRNTTSEGKKLVQTRHGVLLEIGRTATSKDLTCYVFILSDATMDFNNGELTSIKY